MGYVLGAICGLIWGAAAALLNHQISKRSILKNNTASLLGANVLRILVDLDKDEISLEGKVTGSIFSEKADEDEEAGAEEETAAEETPEEEKKE